MIEPNDWRLTNQEGRLTGRPMARIPYFRWSETWDHEHCDFCGSKFSSAEDDLHEGYVTADDWYTWVCPECFEDFREMFRWELVDAAPDPDAFPKKT